MSKIKIEYQLVDEDSKAPQMFHSDDMCLDLCSRKDMLIKHKEVSLVPLGIKFNFPRGVEAKIYSGSSTPIKFGLTASNGSGCIDAGYKDEIHFVCNSIVDMKQVYKGDRIAQIEFFRYVQLYDIDNNIVNAIVKIPNNDIEFVEVEEFTNYGNDREGGFGSTGN